MNTKVEIELKCKNYICSLIKNGNLPSQNEEYFNKRIISKWPDFYDEFKKPGICFFKDCDKITIKNSHSISKSNCLKSISDKDHLFQPQYDYFKKLIQMKYVGINDASVFPGFCEEHENVFKDFERSNNIIENSLVLYQSYRILCREIFYYKSLMKTSNSILKEYRTILSEEATTKYYDELTNNGISKDDVGPIKFEITDSRLNEIEISTKKHQEYILNLKSFKNKFDDFISQNENNRGLQHKGEKYQFKLPVAMGGCVQVNLKIGKPFLFLLNVLPINDYTYVFMISDSSNMDYFNTIIENYFGNHFKILKLIESFMIYGTDNWYVSPAFWESIKDNLKSDILSNMLFSPVFGFQDVPFGIFNNIRDTI